MAMPPEPLLTVKQAASGLDRSVKTVRRMIERGELHAVRLGGRVMIRESEVRRMLRVRHLPRNTAAERVVQTWFAVCGTSDPWVVIEWLAEGTIDFRARHPGIARAEARRTYGAAS